MRPRERTKGGKRMASVGEVVARDIEAELAFHLDASARDIAAHGLKPDEAASEAQRRFGDVEAIRSKCWRIDMENHIMMKRIHVAVTVVLVLVVGVLAAMVFTAWRSAAMTKEQLNVQTTTTHALQEQLHTQTTTTRTLEQQLQVQTEATRALQEQLKSLQVSSAADDQDLVYLEGDIARPGVYHLPRHGVLNVARLLAAAGGSESAGEGRVTLLRRNHETGEEEVILNLTPAELRAHPERDIPLLADDLVRVVSAASE